MTTGFQDWTRAIRLVAIDADGNPVTILADEDGKLYSLTTGQDADGVLRAVRVDGDGQIIMVPRGASGNYMDVDTSGFLTTVMKGLDGANLRTIAVDAGGKLVAIMKGTDGTTLRTIAIDTNGQMVMVPRGASGNYMAVDSDGYITAVLKGLFAGALRTIGLDDEGRITAYMVDDESQWGDIVKTGNAELAARLGSPVAWDWRGKVIWWTDFRYGLTGLHTFALGSGGGVALDPARSLSGGYSLKLVGGSSLAGYAYVSVVVDVPPSPRVGIYVRWASDSEFDYLNLQMQLYDGVTYREAFIRYDRDANEINYQDKNQAWQTLGVQKFYFADHAWHGLKLVVDTEAGTYLRCLAGSTEHDMSLLDLYEFASAVDQRLLCSAYVYSHSGNNEYAWIDSMVITVGEPT